MYRLVKTKPYWADIFFDNKRVAICLRDTSKQNWYVFTSRKPNRILDVGIHHNLYDAFDAYIAHKQRKSGANKS